MHLWKLPDPSIFCGDWLHLDHSVLWSVCVCWANSAFPWLLQSSLTALPTSTGRFFFVQLLLCCIMVKFSVHKASYSTTAKRHLPTSLCSGVVSPGSAGWGEVGQEVSPSPRGALDAAHGECGEGLNQGNAKSRRMISRCPPRGNSLLSSSVTELLAVRERLHKVRCSLGGTRSSFSE